MKKTIKPFVIPDSMVIDKPESLEQFGDEEKTTGAEPDTQSQMIEFE